MTYLLFDFQLFGAVNVRIWRYLQRHERPLDTCWLVSQFQKCDRLAESWNCFHSCAHNAHQV